MLSLSLPLPCVFGLTFESLIKYAMTHASLQAKRKIKARFVPGENGAEECQQAELVARAAIEGSNESREREGVKPVENE